MSWICRCISRKGDYLYLLGFVIGSVNHRCCEGWADFYGCSGYTKDLFSNLEVFFGNLIVNTAYICSEMYFKFLKFAFSNYSCIFKRKMHSCTLKVLLEVHHTLTLHLSAGHFGVLLFSYCAAVILLEPTRNQAYWNVPWRSEQVLEFCFVLTNDV